MGKRTVRLSGSGKRGKAGTAKPRTAAAIKAAGASRAPAKAGLRAAASPIEGRKPKCLVLSGFGLNSESELAHAFALGGAEPDIVHFSDVSSGARKLEDYQIFAIPGGWSYADDISSGRVLANKLRTSFREQFESFVSSGKPVLGICNGFQVLSKLGALPNLSLTFSQEATLAANASGRFEDRWVWLKPQKAACPYFEGVEFIHCPVRHGEGRFLADSATLSSLEKKKLVALKYADDRLEVSQEYPWNPNGAARSIAGICDTTGRVLAMMPHPECSVQARTFPRFTAGLSYEKNSIRFFQNMVEAAREYV